MATVAQYIFSGLAIGGIYALVALGFHIMWSAARAVNFAHGDTLMIGGLIAAYLVASGWSLALACALAILLGGVFGFALERLAVRPFAGQANSIGWMLTTIAVGIMVESVATVETEGYALPLPSPGVDGSVQILGAGLYPQELTIPAIALIAMFGLRILQRRTLIGRAMQAVAHNKNAAALMGIDVNLVIAFSFWWGKHKNDKAVRQRMDPWKLKLPVFGKLFQKIAVSRFTRNFGTMIHAGVPILQALDIVGETSGNLVIEKAAKAVQESVRRGESLAGPLSQHAVFPPMVVQMMAVGEDTGALDTMLGKIADFYDAEVEATTEQLTSLIEPLMIVVIGAIIGAMVIAMYMPIFGVFDLIS